jgi:hypothetical protein
MTDMTQLEFPDDFPGLPESEDSAADVVRRYFADRGIECLDGEARRIVREKRNGLNPQLVAAPFLSLGADPLVSCLKYEGRVEAVLPPL